MKLNNLFEKVEYKIPDFNYLKSIANKKCISITFCNPSAIKCFNENKDYRLQLNEIDYIYSDGMLLCNFLKLVNGKKYERLSFDGNSIAPYFFNFAKKNNFKTCFIGSKPGISDKAKDIISKEFNLDIPLSFNGYFNENEFSDILKKLKDNNIKLIVIGMGVPKQELVANKIKNYLDAGIVITCGGYLDQIVNSNSLKYYPKLFSILNLRFLYRVLKEPKKMISRYIFDYMPFYKIYIKNIFKN